MIWSMPLLVREVTGLIPSKLTEPTSTIQALCSDKLSEGSSSDTKDNIESTSLKNLYNKLD